MISFGDFIYEFRTFPEARYRLKDIDHVDVTAIVKPRASEVSSLADMMAVLREELEVSSFPDNVEVAARQIWGTYEVGARYLRRFEVDNSQEPTLGYKRALDLSRGVGQRGAVSILDNIEQLEEQNMSLESVLKDLTDAVIRNSELLTELLDGQKGGSKDGAKDGAKDSSSGRGRRSSEEKPAASSRSRDKLTAKELTDKVRDWLDSAKTDDEYDRRVDKVISPFLDDNKVEAVGELPEKAWQDLLDAIEKDGAKDSSSGRGRRRPV